MPPRAAGRGTTSAAAPASDSAESLAAAGPSSKILWLAFLREWSTEASALGSRAAHAYQKASYSIKNAQQDFTHPAELISLNGIGPLIVSKLTQRLEEWCTLHAQAMPARPESASGSKGKKKASNSASTSASSSRAPKRKRTAPEAAADIDQTRGSDDDILGFGPGDNDSTTEDEGDAEAQVRRAIANSLNEAPAASSSATAKAAKAAPAKKKRAPAAPKGYVPGLRTGGYGILLGLLTQCPTIDDEVYLTKAELVPLAQPYCDSDYLMASKSTGPGSRGSAAGSRVPATVTGAAGAASRSAYDGSNRSNSAPISYTAWNSMKTLVLKGLVYQTGNPPRYCLSEEGWRLADRMRNVDETRSAAASEKSSASPERLDQQRRPANDLGLSRRALSGASNSALDQESSTGLATIPAPSRNSAARSALQIPVTKPGLFSSSDPPSSSPQDVLPAAGPSTSRRDPQIVVLPDTPEPDHVRPLRRSSPVPQEINRHLGARANPFERVPSFGAESNTSETSTTAPRRRANPLGPGPERNRDWTVSGNSLRVPFRDALMDDSDEGYDELSDLNAQIPGSQQSLAIAISDSDDERQDVFAGPSLSRSRPPPIAHRNGIRIEQDIAGNEADDTLLAELPLLRPPMPSTRTLLRAQSGPIPENQPCRKATASSSNLVLERSHSDSMTSLPLDAPRNKARRAQVEPPSPRRQHKNRLPEAMPRRDVGAMGLGWQAQVQAQLGTSQHEDLDLHIDDEHGSCGVNRVQPPTAGTASRARPTHREPADSTAKEVGKYDQELDDSDFDIESIMRDVENGIAAREGRPLPPQTTSTSSKNKDKQVEHNRKAGRSTDLASEDDDFEVVEVGTPKKQGRGSPGGASPQPSPRPVTRTRPRDSLPAVPQPLLPGMAAVSVAADSSFDMFDHEDQVGPTGLETPNYKRLLPPRSSGSLAMPSSSPDAYGASRGDFGSTSAPLRPSGSQNRGRNSVKSSEWTPPAFRPVIWPAGSYDIILLLDTREVKHGNSSSTNRPTANTLNPMGVNDTIRGPRCHLSGPLLDKGVPVEVRALELGDVVWIARKKESAGTETDEVVLDYVVERKRLDDLVQSIPDGRWKEQKFRLSLSGLSKVFYLIEDYQVEQQMRQWGPQIATAISSTQVIDGFFVQRTAGVEASLEWLRKMHSVIEEMHKNKPLYVLPDSILSRPTYLRLQTHLRRTQPMTPHHITFASYRSMNSKSGSVTVGEVWARMLLCTRGMSEEKVGEAIRIWRTGAEWWDACKAVEAGEDDDDEPMTTKTTKSTKAAATRDSNQRGRSLMADHVGGMELHALAGAGLDKDAAALLASMAQFDSRKKVGHALSAKVWDLWMKERYSSK
ncbi:Crossover junction endonuclease mus81 [Tilletia horrida]|nr:Crossover junction endonuclease mus81 [Tilletia horrida]